MNKFKLEKTDEEKLEDFSFKLQMLMDIIKCGNYDKNIVKDTKYFMACHKILMDKVYSDTSKEVESVPLIVLK